MYMYVMLFYLRVKHSSNWSCIISMTFFSANGYNSLDRKKALAGFTSDPLYFQFYGKSVNMSTSEGEFQN